ncbi:MAG: hypothetical protein JKY70_11345 [Mucilaginibacter sp.]|nr:hypothetical protein [Mucilaginibacter sp.]
MLPSDKTTRESLNTIKIHISLFGILDFPEGTHLELINDYWLQNHMGNETLIVKLDYIQGDWHQFDEFLRNKLKSDSPA